MTMTFVVMLGHVSLSGLLTNMTMSFVVMHGHVSLSGLLTNMNRSFVVMLGHVSLSGLFTIMNMSFIVFCKYYFQILQHVQVSSGLNHYFLSYRVHRRKDGKTERHARRHADGHEYSIVGVDKPQL